MGSTEQAINRRKNTAFGRIDSKQEIFQCTGEQSSEKRLSGEQSEIILSNQCMQTTIPSDPLSFILQTLQEQIEPGEIQTGISGYISIIIQ